MMKPIAAAAIIIAGLSTPLQAQQFHPCPMGQSYGMGAGYGMPMMGGGMPMMGGGMPMMGGQHIEGRLAFLKTELRITAAQNGAWLAYADALRQNSDAMNALMREMMQTKGMMGQGMMGQGMMGQGMMGQGMMGQAEPQPLAAPERFDLIARHMAAHLDMLERLRTPLQGLYDSLDADQKRIADQLLIGPMGMM
jgi:hypothetical protein